MSVASKKYMPSRSDLSMSSNLFLEQQKLIQAQSPAVSRAIKAELLRQQNKIEMIASENFTSPAVMAAQGSVMTNKYAEGYPGCRYYNGCEYVDEVEELARDFAKQMFGAADANVQPHSGSQANQAAFMALIKPGDTVLGMDLACGGHLSHGASFNVSGKTYRGVAYHVDQETYLLDYDKIESLALEHKPQLIIAGASAYARQIDFKRFREIADKAGAYLLADVAHYSGLIVSGIYDSPLPHAHVVTTTTHKTLRGPRSGLIVTNDFELHKKINSAVFPGLQGGPLMHVIAAKAIAFEQALTDEFKEYSQATLNNAIALADRLMEEGFKVITDGTDSHIVLVDLRPQNLTGKCVADELDRIGITCNMNSVPFDTRPPIETSGIRLGSPAATTRGFGQDEFIEIADIIVDVIHVLEETRAETLPDNKVDNLKARVKNLCDQYPLYSEFAN